MSTARNFTKKSLDQLAFSENGKPLYYSDTKTAGLKLKIGKLKKTFILEKRISGIQGAAPVMKLGTFPTMTIDSVRREANRLASLCEQGIDPRQEQKAQRISDETMRIRSTDEKNGSNQTKTTGKKGVNPNHPRKGSSIKVSPVKDRDALARIKENLRNHPRDLCFFIFGINTAFRACELLSLRVSHVRNLKVGDDFEIKLSKTKSYRRVTVNHAVVNAVSAYLSNSGLGADDWLFPSDRTGEPLEVSTVSTYVKTWCQNAGLQGNYASHTLRKTWGYWQRVANDTPIPLLMAAYGHSNQRQTLQYLCIQNEEISDVYLNLEL